MNGYHLQRKRKSFRTSWTKSDSVRNRFTSILMNFQGAQRIGIARSLTLKPKLIIADEPVSALDVSVQAQVLNFLQDLQQEFNLTYLFVGHDLGVIRHMCDRMGVMYRGRLVEEGNSDEIYENPQHIYTKRLIAAIPDLEPEVREEKVQLRKNYQQSMSRLIQNFSMKMDVLTT